MPRVSVVLTSFNHEQFLRESIDSVLRQDFADLELIILDDASTDQSWWHIHDQRDARITALRATENGQITELMNKAIFEIATGEYIAIQHSDDVWETDKLTKQVAYLDQHRTVGAAFTDATAIDEDGKPLDDPNHFYSSIFAQPNRSRHEWLRHFFNHGNALCHPSVLIRKTCFEECGPYKPWVRQIDDFDMWIRIALKHELHVIPEKLTRFRVRKNEANVSGNHRTARVRNAFEYYGVLNNYRAIADFGELCAIFPEARKFYRDKGTVLPFALGMAALEVAIRPFGRLFALGLLQEVISIPAERAALEANYGFTYKDFTRLTGEHDVFALEEVAVLQRDLMERDRRIVETATALDERSAQIANLRRGADERDVVILDLNRAVSERNERIASFDRAAMERDELILRLDRSLSASKDQQVDLEQRVAQRDERIAELTPKFAALQSELDHLAALRRAADVRAEGLAHAVTTLEAAHAAWRTQYMSAMESQLAMHRESILALRQLNDGLTARVAAILSSRSWRLSGPVRLIGRWMRRGADRPAALAGSALPPTSAASSPIDFDPAYYLETHADVRNAGIDPYEHYLQYGQAEGRSAQRPLDGSKLARTATSEQAPQQTPQADAIEEKASDSGRGPAQPPAGFDAEFYLETYPDIRAAGIDPYEHYRDFGRLEGRLGTSPTLDGQPGAIPFDPEKATVLVVSHEASRTGAPVLSLNIAKRLGDRFNVVVLLLGGGTLASLFVENSCSVAGPVSLKGSEIAAARVIATLCAPQSFAFAVVNSIESRFVLKALTERGIPTVTLIHEFATYTRPVDAFSFAIQWSVEAVFSARITHDNAISLHPEIASDTLHIIPQGQCAVPAIDVDASTRAAAKDRIVRQLRPRNEPAVVIVGAGHVQYRKGVDLFLECAANVVRRAPDIACRFVWIGGGYDPQKDLGYSVYLAEQVKRAGLEQVFAFANETAFIEDVYDGADLLLLSSRLDPLPNVAIDAMSRGLPVTCFAESTGIADMLIEAGLGEECVAPYADTAEMARLVAELAGSAQKRQRLGARMQEMALQRFDMTRYIAQLEALGEAAQAQLAREFASADTIARHEALDLGFHLRTPAAANDDPVILARRYVRSWASGIDRRRPVPGFHPAIYAEHRMAHALPGQDPYAAYLEAGQPAGPWAAEVLRPNDSESAGAEAQALSLRSALHIHAYYPDLLEDMLARIGRNASRPDLFISVPDEEAATQARRLAQDYPGTVARVDVVPNSGRDLGPLLTAYGQALAEGYEVIGHVHTKKSRDIADSATGRVWHRFLMESLIGGQAPMMDTVLGRMAADPAVGLVFPEDPHVVDWGSNRPFAVELAARLGIHGLPDHPTFPVGSMFWARTRALKPLFDLGLDWSDYPTEPLPYDGSMLHAIERLFPQIATLQGMRWVVTHVPGVTR